MSRHGSVFKLIISIVIILFIIAYAIFNSRLLIKGPSIEIYDLRDGQTIEENVVNIRGHAKNISFLSLNGRQIFINENGDFDEELLLTNRINPIEIYAKDKFDKEVLKKLTLIHHGEIPPLPYIDSDMIKETGTTTATTTTNIEQVN